MNNAAVLLGPADPDHFRTKVGRYKDRWYVDPMPGDDIAPATDKAWPAFSTIKGVSTPSWNQSQSVAIRRIASAYRATPHRLDGLDERDTIAVLSMWNEGDLHRAGDRGTAVHHYIEYVKLRGMPSMIDLSAAEPYMPAVDAFFAAYGPVLAAAEIVVIHRHLNGVGYGGTIDAVLVITVDGRRYVVDWKTRGEDSEHAAYTEEAAQLGAYAGAEYCIMDVGGHARRVPMADLGIDGGLLVSIKPDGVRVYPVDLGLAFDYFTAMHAWWNAKRTDAESIGKPWAPIPVATNSRHLTLVQPSVATAATTVPGASAPAVATTLPTAARRERLIPRIMALVEQGHGPALQVAWPPGVPGLAHEAHTDADLVAILRVVERVSDDAGLPFHDDDGTPSTASEPVTQTAGNSQTTRSEAINIDEGADVEVGDLHALHARFAALTDDQRAWVGVVASHANEAGRSISLNQRPSVRRYEIGRALVLLVETTWRHAEGKWADVFVRAVLAHVIGTDRDDTTPIGAVLSTLTPDEARWVADIAMAVGTDALHIQFDSFGRYDLSGPVMHR